MTPELTARAIEKIAYNGEADVIGRPYYMPPPPTVGQMMYDANADRSLSGQNRRSILDSIVGTGISVDKPAGSLLGAGIGALAGNFIANALKAGPFWRGIATAAGAGYGYRR